MDLFIALLARRKPLVIPARFAHQYADALQAAINPHERFPDFRYATRLIDDSLLATNLELLFSALPDLEQNPWCYLDLAGQGRVLKSPDDAHKANRRLMENAYYKPIKRRFDIAFPYVIRNYALPPLDLLVEAREKAL